MSSRTGRTVTRQGRRLRITERDRWLLEALGKMRFLTTAQLARLAFNGSRWAANKRLRKLLDAGLVRVWLRSLSEENVYSLTLAGARMLGDQGVPSTTPRGLDGNLDHLLAINQVRIALALTLHDAGGELAWWRSDWELPRRGRAPVVPDALFAVRWADNGQQLFALEVDIQSRSPQAFIKKILRYQGLTSQKGRPLGLAPLLVLAVGRDPRSVERYRLGLGHAGLGARVWFTTLAALAKTPAGPIWVDAKGGERTSLRDLALLPYGKEEPSAGDARW